MSLTSSRPSKQECESMRKTLIEEVIILNYAGPELFQVKSATALALLKQKYPWFQEKHITRFYHFAEGVCQCGETLCTCFYYTYHVSGTDWCIFLEDH